MLGLGNGGVVFAEQFVPSGLAAVLVATSPFWMAAVEACLPDGERLRKSVVVGSGDRVQRDRPARLAGSDVRIAGSGSFLAGRGFLAGVVALQIASIGWSIGSSYSKRHGRRAAAAASQTHSSGMDEILGTTAYQMLAGGLMMTAAGTARGEWAEIFFTTRTTVAFVLPVDGRRARRIRRLRLCAAAPAGVVRLALRLHQPCDCRRARRPRAARTVHVAHGLAAALVFAGVAVVRVEQRPGTSRVAAPAAAPAERSVA